MKFKAMSVAAALIAGVLIGGVDVTVAAPSPGTPGCVPDASSPATTPPVSTGPGSIAGTIGVGGGDTIEGVTVVVTDHVYSESHTVDTDADGNFSFSGLPFNSYRIGIIDAAYPSVYYCGATDEFSATPVTIDAAMPDVDDVDVLVGPGTITGTVTDGTNPIEFAQIQIEIPATADTRYVSTDVNGTYTVAGLEYGDHIVSAQVNGSHLYLYLGNVTSQFESTPILLDSTNPTGNADIQFSTGGVAGTVVDLPEGNVVAIDTATGLRYSTTAESDGTFLLPYLPDGEYSFQIDDSTSTLRRAAETSSIVGGAITSGVSLSLAVGSIEGTVYVFGAPLDGNFGYSSVTATNVATDQQEYDDAIDEFGAYSLPNLPDGDYRVHVYDMSTNPTCSTPTRPTRNWATIVTISGDARTGIDLTFPSGPGTITGTISAGGVAVAGAPVSVYDDSYDFIRSTSTDVNGTYSLSGIVIGNYRVRASVNGTTRWNGGFSNQFDAPFIELTEVEPGATVDLDFPTGGFSGTILDSGGTAADDFLTIRAELVGGSEDASTGPDFDTGAFELTNLAAGDWRLSVSLTSGGSFPVGTFATDGSSVTSGLALTIPDGSISGTILDNGIPFNRSDEGFTVSLYQLDGTLLRNIAMNQDGTYRFDNVLDGSYLLAAQKSWSGMCRTLQITFTGDLEPRELTFAFS